MYETPTQGVRLVVPSVLALTTLIERGVVSIAEDGHGRRRITVAPTPVPTETPSGPKMSIGEDEFFELLGQQGPLLPSLLKGFLAKAEALGVYVERQGGLNLKHTSPAGQPLNMATITKGGVVDTGVSTWWGRESAGQTYNESLRNLMGGSLIAVKIGATPVLRGADGKMPRLSDLLPQHEEGWLLAMERYILDNLAASRVDE